MNNMFYAVALATGWGGTLYTFMTCESKSVYSHDFSAASGALGSAYAGDDPQKMRKAMINDMQVVPGVCLTMHPPWGVCTARPRQNWCTACDVPDRRADDGLLWRGPRAHPRPVERPTLPGWVRARRFPRDVVTCALDGGEAEAYLSSPTR